MSLCGLPLALAIPGDRVEITGLAGGRALQQRLADLGVLAGRTLRVVHKQGCGRMVVAVGDARIALGRGMAAKIMVTPSAKTGCECNEDQVEESCVRRPRRRRGVCAR